MARAEEKKKEMTEKISKELAAVAPSEEAKKKVFETGLQEAKIAIKDDYQKALDDHNANPQALKDKEAEVERDEKELTTINKKVTEGRADASDIAKKNALALNIKAVGDKIAMTKAAINAAAQVGKTKKTFGEAIDEHVEKTMDQTHAALVKKTLKEAGQKVNEMHTANKEAYLTRSVPDRVKREQFRGALKKKGEADDASKVLKALRKAAGEEEAPVPAAEPRPPTPPAA